MANDPSGNVTDNPMRTPSVSGDNFDVYSAEQFIYAVKHLQTGQSITLKGNIDFNGEKIDRLIFANDATLNGEGNTIYNAVAYIPGTYNPGTDSITDGICAFMGFKTESTGPTIKNIVFSNISLFRENMNMFSSKLHSHMV